MLDVQVQPAARCLATARLRPRHPAGGGSRILEVCRSSSGALERLACESCKSISGLVNSQPAAAAEFSKLFLISHDLDGTPHLWTCPNADQLKLAGELKL